jgi:2,3-bisphosphoglycerate-independent phosphoglycerate mutase
MEKTILKLIYVIIDGVGDFPVKELGNETPLGAADTPNMDNLARNGKTGLMYTAGKGIAPESDVGVISILGYDPFNYATGRGILEAVGAGMKVRNGNLALRCNFATMGKRNALVDRRAGRDLATDETKRLSETIQKNVTLTSHPADFEFRSTTGHRAVLVIKAKKGKLSSKITNTDPAYTRLEGMGVAEKEVEMVLKKCEPLDKSEEAKISADLVNEFTEKSHQVMDKHEVNQKRVEKGKLKANVILARDAGHMLPPFFNLNKEYNMRFVCLADMPVERGIAELAGMDLVDLPPPSTNLKKDCLLRVEKLFGLMPRYDCFYIHIKGPDEPGHDGNFKLKTELISIIDKFFFGELLPKINLSEFIICVASDHATPCELKAHSDDPVPVLIAGNKIRGDGAAKFSEKECKKGSLGILQKGSELMPKLMSFVKHGEILRKG